MTPPSVRWTRRAAMVRVGVLASLGGVGFARTAFADSYTDFFRAVETDSARRVRELLLLGFEPNTPDLKGQQPLFLALRGESFQVAEVLLSDPRHRPDVANEHGETPLMMAALRGQLNWVQRLVERGAAVNRTGWGPLHYAATGPSPQVVGWLLDRGAQIDARAPNGATPLMMAAQYGAEDSVQLLLDRGADLKLRNERGWTAVEAARAGGRDPLAQRLAGMAGAPPR
ncbi:MAG: ankyrin repeat domain-containing protein [Rubrivivax sp.]|jgi:ankyrin repeat protein